MPPDPESSPIFVVGTGRSGTTLLRMMLCAHPRIYLAHEASFYVWEKAGESLGRYLARYLNGFSFRWLRLDPAVVLRDLAPEAERRLVYTRIMRALAERYGKPRWGDKTPSHSGNLARIFEDFPDARVVRIVRDPRAVVRSLMRMPWGPPSLIAGSVLVGLEHRQCSAFEDRVLRVRLEDLLANPRAVMEQVLAFVEEPFDEAVLHHIDHLPDPPDMPPVPWFENATKAPKPRPAPPAPDPIETRLLEFLNGKALRETGYAPAVLASEPSSLQLVWAYLRDVPALLRSAWVLLRLLRQAESGEESEASRAVGRSLNPEAWARYPGFTLPWVPENPEGWRARLPK